jgi:hypothetical protein
MPYAAGGIGSNGLHQRGYGLRCGGGVRLGGTSDKPPRCYAAMIARVSRAAFEFFRAGCVFLQSADDRLSEPPVGQHTEQADHTSRRAD